MDFDSEFRSINDNKSLCVFSLDIVNTLYNAKIFSSVIFLYSKKTTSIHIGRMNIDYEMFKVQQFCLSVIVITKKFFNK